MAEKNGKTRPFNAVNYSAARLAREKQRREYEQQKKEKLIFALFVVIILVMILFAILIFRNVLGGEDPITNDTDVNDTDSVTPPDTDTVTVSESYEDKKIPKSDLYAGHLLLIDSSHAYRSTEAVTLENIYGSRTKFEKASAKNGYVYSYYTAGTEEELDVATLAALNAMADDFYKLTGNNDLYIHTNSAYVKNASDEHATGRAFDLSVYTIDYVHYELDDSKISSDFDWIKENYYKYGFIRRYPENKAELTGVSDDPYHFLYVGTAHAYYMYTNGLCLEEYLELLRTEHAFNGGENNLAITTEDGVRYEVYYVPAEGDMVTVPVYINNDSYSISGDNASGFVVTIRLK